MGLKTFIRVAEHLLFHYSPVCESPTWKEWDLILSQLHYSYHLIVTSPLSLGMGYLFPFWLVITSSCQWLFNS